MGWPREDLGFVEPEASFRKRDILFFKDFMYLFKRESKHERGKVRGRNRPPARQGAGCRLYPRIPGS